MKTLGIKMTQIKALRLALREGNVVAGYNISGGRRHLVAFSTLVSCADRGWLQLRTPLGGGEYWILTDAGLALPCLREGGTDYLSAK